MSEQETSGRKPHSAEFFNDMRDHWWNRDFLELMARRLELARVGSVLDVGCGVGHWGRVLAAVLAPSARLIGVDREAQWVAKATENAERAGLGSRFSYQQGDATALPFADGTFDMVTCQTVLMHLPDARAGLREMMRVVKPGGLVLAVEPCNMASMAICTSVTDTFPADVVADTWRFHLLCHRGKRALGLGFNSVGDLLPGYMAELGAQDLKVYMADRATPMLPPYELPHQQAERKQFRDWYAREFWVWEKSETKRYFMAGGGSETEFERLWQMAGRQMAAEIAATDAGTFHCANPHITYLVSGRK